MPDSPTGGHLRARRTADIGWIPTLATFWDAPFGLQPYGYHPRNTAHAVDGLDGLTRAAVPYPDRWFPGLAGRSTLLRLPD